MTLRSLTRSTVAALALCATGTALADATFEVRFSGHVDCFSPYELENVPLSLKGTGVLRTDGTARMDWKLTAYHLLTAPAFIEGKLGDRAKPMGDGGKASLNVLNRNGLALILDYPHTKYALNIAVDGKKCGAELLAKPKSRKKIYDIFALDTQFFCSRFEVEKSSCRAR